MHLLLHSCSVHKGPIRGRGSTRHILPNEEDDDDDDDDDNNNNNIIQTRLKTRHTLKQNVFIQKGKLKLIKYRLIPLRLCVKFCNVNKKRGNLKQHRAAGWKK